MKNLFKILILILFTFSFGRVCIDGEEVELWGKCYNIDKTFRIEKHGVGYIPPEIGNLKNLSHLFLGGNQIRSIPPEIGNLKNLVLLRLENNNIKSIPSEIKKLTKLEFFSLSNNYLKGEISSSILKLSNLERLELKGNQLTGVIPSEISNLTKLEWLDLSNNKLSGEIPESLSNLENLKNLDLTNNQLSGEIPKGLKELWEEFKVHILGNKSYNECSSPIIKKYYDNGNLSLEKFSSDNRVQKWIKYHKNGKKWYEVEYKKWSFYRGKEKIGVYTEWYESGKIKQIENHSVIEYDYTLKKFSYYSNGKVKVEKNYYVEFIESPSSPKPGTYKHGTWIYYNEDGSLQKEEIYKDGELIETKEY